VTGWETAPIEPGPCRWRLPDPRAAAGDLVGIGGDLAPSTLLAAYRGGLFPMPVRRRRLGWWSPDPRGIIPLTGLHVSRSLRRATRRYDVRVDSAFAGVMAACGDPSRPHGWITREIIAAYGELHRLGWAHSVESFAADGRLVGGVYGVRIGRLFAAESMFHRATDAGKVALVALFDRLREDGATLFDVQWVTPHLATLGAVDISRDEYLRRLTGAVADVVT
jgi:leucyl/phenylalanyl-tRNA--protein transferase